jgi:hypothetical protein
MNGTAKEMSKPLDGIPVLIERDGDRIAIHAGGFGEVSDRLEELVGDLRGREQTAFRLKGTLMVYRGWTPQPEEVCEASLTDPDERSGSRVLLLIDDVEALSGKTLDGLSYEERFRILADNFPDSDGFQKRFLDVSGGQDRHDSGAPAIPAVWEKAESTRDHSSSSAVDVLYSCGYLDLEGVEARLTRMRQRLEARDAEVRALQGRIAKHEEKEANAEPLLELGRTCLERFCREATSRLRAIQLHRGERPEDTARLTILESNAPDPVVVRELHRSITDEFQALYPTGRSSAPTDTGDSTRVRWDWDSFRIPRSTFDSPKDSVSRDY